MRTKIYGIQLLMVDLDNRVGSEFNPTLGSFVTSNIDARAIGVEGNLQLRVATGLTVDGSAAYNDGKVRATGNQLISAPKFNGTLSTTYERPVANGVSLQLGEQFSYVSRYPHQFDLNPFNFTPSHINLDARIGMKLARPDILISLVAKNLTNEHYTEFAFGNPAAPGQSFNHQLNRPRSFAITLRAGF